MTKADKIALFLLASLVLVISAAFTALIIMETRGVKVTNYCDTGKQNRIYVYEDKFQVVYDPTCETE